MKVYFHYNKHHLNLLMEEINEHRSNLSMINVPEWTWLGDDGHVAWLPIGIFYWKRFKSGSGAAAGRTSWANLWTGLRAARASASAPG